MYNIKLNPLYVMLVTVLFQPKNQIAKQLSVFILVGTSTITGRPHDTHKAHLKVSVIVFGEVTSITRLEQSSV